MARFPLLVNTLASVGRASFGIYLIHLYILNHLVTKVFSGWLVSSVITIILSYGIVLLGKHMLGKKSKWLGFEI